MKLSLKILGSLIALLLIVNFVSADDAKDQAKPKDQAKDQAKDQSKEKESATPAAAPAEKQGNTVGVDIIKLTTNPDKSLTALFQWKDKDGKMVQRSVILNEGTVIGVDGELKTLADVNQSLLKHKVVATVGPDGITAVNLRFGRKMVEMSKEKLTPAQIAALNAAAPKPTAASNDALQKRVASIVESLSLKDAGKEARLKVVLLDDLTSVRDTHNAGFAPDKSVHANLIAGLKADLTPDQIEVVKDKLTIGKVPFTYRAYHDIVPDLTAQEDAKILELLKQAREDSLDVKNPDEMSPIFEKYKTQIEKYLNSNGRDWKKIYKDYTDQQKAGKSEKAASATKTEKAPKADGAKSGEQPKPEDKPDAAPAK